MIETIRRYFTYFVLVVSAFMIIRELEVVLIEIKWDVILACCCLIFIMLVLILMSFIFEKKHGKHKKIKYTDVIGMLFFAVIPLVYIGIFYFNLPFIPYIQLIVITTMLIECVYSLGM